MEDPEGIETVLEGQNKIIVKGISKEKVGQYAAEIRDKKTGAIQGQRYAALMKLSDVKLVKLVRNK